MESARIQLLDEPISPELCLVDPELAQRARQLAPFRPFTPRVVPAPPVVQVVQREPARLVPVAAPAPVEGTNAVRSLLAGSITRYWPLLMPAVVVGVLIALSLGRLSSQSPEQAAPAVHIPDQAPTTIPAHASAAPSSARSSVPKTALEPTTALKPKRTAAPSTSTPSTSTIVLGKSATGATAAGSTSALTLSHPLAPAAKAVRKPPATRGVVSGVAPVTLRWTAVNGALLYDVILWRGTTRVLDLWPTTTHVVVPASWTYDGKVFHRTAGMHFLWFVYPALGSKTSPTYGSLIRSGAF